MSSVTLPTTEISDTSDHDLGNIVDQAVAAGVALADASLASRAVLLRSIASRLEGASADLVQCAVAESGLTEARLNGELVRTTFQLRSFADLVVDGRFLGAGIDHADPSWPPAPKPDLRRLLTPLGPVVVFAGSNFPFAFSVAGGDTASALAAGCPVVVKVHPGHPHLSVATAELVRAGAQDAGFPVDVLQLVHGEAAGRAAVTHRSIRAAAFTGSLAGGRALFDLAASRPAPASTSVGDAAIERFLRPLSYQSVPDAMLPAALQESNPLGIPRLVDGVSMPRER
jgi:NADP-dependent aldehyde dehydrogenase